MLSTVIASDAMVRKAHRSVPCCHVKRNFSWLLGVGILGCNSSFKSFAKDALNDCFGRLSEIRWLADDCVYMTTHLLLTGGGGEGGEDDGFMKSFPRLCPWCWGSITTKVESEEAFAC